MAKQPLSRPDLIKPDNSNGDRQKLTNLSVTKKRTTSESPKTVRMTTAEKMLAAQLVEEIQVLTNKNITVSTLLRAGLYLAQNAGPEEVLKVIKENI